MNYDNYKFINQAGELKYIEAPLDLFSSKEIKNILKDKLKEIKSILEETNGNKGLKYNLAREKIKEKLRYFFDFKKMANIKIGEYENLLNKFDDIKNFLYDNYDINLKISNENLSSDEELRILLENIILTLDIDLNNDFDSLVLKKILSNFFDKIYNFIYIYEEQIDLLGKDSENKIILELIDGKINLYTEKEVEQNKYDTTYEKSEKNILGKLLNKEPKKEEPNYLKNRPNLLNRPEIKLAEGNPPQQEELSRIKYSIGEKEVDYVNLPSQLKDLGILFKK